MFKKNKIIFLLINYQKENIINFLLFRYNQIWWLVGYSYIGSFINYTDKSLLTIIFSYSNF